MKLFFGLVIASVLLLNGCSAIMNGKYVTEKGKESPFLKRPDPYEIPKDPTSNR